MSDDPLIGALLAGRYRLEKKLGQGGMGAVYAARQEPLGRPVAVKVLLAGLTPDLQATERFQVEATAVARLNHRGIVTIYDYGKADDGTHFLAMELLTGRSLHAHLKARGRLPWPEALFIARQIASALAAAHDAGIVHRDLKPDNIMLVDDVVDGRATTVVKILDFGLAKLVETDGQLTQRSVIMGTPGYMAPEQINSLPVDARCDLYALGVILWQMLVGRMPITDDAPMKILMRHLSEAIPAPSYAARDAGIPRAGDAVVLRLVEKDRAQRPTTAQVVQVLDEIAREPWAGPAAQALPQASAFDASDWDAQFSALSGDAQPPKSTSTLLLHNVVLPAATPPPATRDVPPPSAPQRASSAATSPSPAPVPGPRDEAALGGTLTETLRPSDDDQAALRAALQPPPLSPQPGPQPVGVVDGGATAPLPPLPAVPRFGPPPPRAAGALELERPTARPTPSTTTTTAVTAATSTTSTTGRTPIAAAAAVAVLVGAAGLVVAVRPWERFGRAVVVDDAVVARAEAAGSAGAVDDAIAAVSARVADGARDPAVLSTLAWLLLERTQLRGGLTGDDERALAGLAGPGGLDDAGRAAAALARGRVAEARALLVREPVGDRERVLFAEVFGDVAPARALAWLQKAGPTQGTRVARARGRALVAAGSINDALVALDARIDDVDDVTAHALRAHARRAAGQPAAARADVDAALQRNPAAALALAERALLVASDVDARANDVKAALSAADSDRDDVNAARVDAARRAFARGALPKADLQAIVDDAADHSADVVRVARAHAFVALGDKAAARALVGDLNVDDADLAPRQRVHAAAVALAAATGADARLGRAYALLRPGSKVGAVARAFHENKDADFPLPLVVALPPAPLDDDDALALAGVAALVGKGGARVIVDVVASAKSTAAAARLKESQHDPIALLLMAQAALAQGDLAAARTRIQRVEAQREVSEPALHAAQLLSARLLAATGDVHAALARLAPLPQDAATLAVAVDVDVAAGNTAGAATTRARLLALDPFLRP